MEKEFGTATSVPLELYIYIYIYLHVRIEDEEEEDGEGRSRRDRESVGWKGVEGREGRGRGPKGNTCQEGSCHDDLSRVSREVAAALHHRRKLPLPSPTPPNPYTRPPLSLLPRENPNKLGFLKASRAKTSEEHLVEEPSPPPPPRFRAVEGGRKEARKGGREGQRERPTGSRRRASHLERKKTRGSATVKFTSEPAAGRLGDGGIWIFFGGLHLSRERFSRRDVRLGEDLDRRWTITRRWGRGERKKRIDGIIGASERKIDRIGARGPDSSLWLRPDSFDFGKRGNELDSSRGKGEEEEKEVASREEGHGWMDKFDRCRPFDGYWPREIYVFSYRV